MTLSLNRASQTPYKAANKWLLVFDNLISLVKGSPKERKVIFIDEISWLDTPRSGFFTALEHFWNGWACSRSDVMLIVCGSATSWMMNKKGIANLHQNCDIMLDQIRAIDNKRLIAKIGNLPQPLVEKVKSNILIMFNLAI